MVLRFELTDNDLREMVYKRIIHQFGLPDECFKKDEILFILSNEAGESFSTISAVVRCSLDKDKDKDKGKNNNLMKILTKDDSE